MKRISIGLWTRRRRREVLWAYCSHNKWAQKHHHQKLFLCSAAAAVLVVLRAFKWAALVAEQKVGVFWSKEKNLDQKRAPPISGIQHSSPFARLFFDEVCAHHAMLVNTMAATVYTHTTHTAYV